MLLGVDVGGTFTDAVIALDGRLFTAKAPTTPADQSLGVMNAVWAALERSGRPASEVTTFAHGMTVATNALLEGRGARTALVATEGFTDVIELGRQARAELYRLCAAHPAPLVPAELRFGAPERMGPFGPLRALDEPAAQALCKRLAAAEPEAVAVALLHSYRHPEHEQRLEELIRAALPDAHVSLSHEVVATFREYERTSTTVVDAALSPLVGRYLRRLRDRALGAGLPEPEIMQSSGGLADLDGAAAHAAQTVLSGPAGGAVAAALCALAAGYPDAVCLDMGGTSCDVCVVEDGALRSASGRTIGGRVVALPMADVHTVGAGGGSIAWRDPGGALRVGPRSAGAEPGPACYGRGGHEPTVTDANLLLGHLRDGAQLAGGVRLSAAAAQRAVGELAATLGLEIERCAAGIVRVANAEMERALRVMTVERGVDPRGYALLAFGGAGPMHACALAEALEIRHVICPQASGVLSAVGLVASERRRDVLRSVLLAGDSLTTEALAADVAEVAAQARAALGDPAAAIRVRCELRYRGQSFELPVETGPRPDPAQLCERFEAAHRERYGHVAPDAEVELVTIAVTAFQPGASVALNAAGPTEPPAGTTISGPDVYELPEATLVVPPGWSGAARADGTIVLERHDA